MLVLVLVAGGRASPASAQTGPALEFTSPTTFRVHPQARLWARDTDMHKRDGKDGAGMKENYFDTLHARQAGAATPLFSVEGQAGAGREYCFDGRCGAVTVEVLAERGDLYLGVDIAESLERSTRTNVGKSRAKADFFEDFPPQRVEVAVQAGQQKVYQEVVVDAPVSAPDCADYPDMNEDRYRCYYTREHLPAATAAPTTAAALVAGLPEQLLQDREEYQVVFAEEFTGSYTPAAQQPDRCDRGLADLDRRKWSYRQKSCRTDPQGIPCEYLADGYLHISRTAQCQGNLSTRGLFEPRYGYLEVRYSVAGTASDQKVNLNLGLGSIRKEGQHALSIHAAPITSLERLLTLTPWLEIAFFEYGPKERLLISHQYRNWGPFVHHREVEPMLSYKLRRYCNSQTQSPSGCRPPGGRVTITEGMEWTPGGYLFLRRVHGDRRYDELEVISKGRTSIYRAARYDSVTKRWIAGWGNQRVTVYGARTDPYFINSDPDDPNYTHYLEALGISHAPLLISLSSWTDTALTEQSELLIDYIRMFQPRNGYADMEPRYQ